MGRLILPVLGSGDGGNLKLTVSQLIVRNSSRIGTATGNLEARTGTQIADSQVLEQIKRLKNQWVLSDFKAVSSQNFES